MTMASIGVAFLIFASAPPATLPDDNRDGLNVHDIENSVASIRSGAPPFGDGAGPVFGNIDLDEAGCCSCRMRPVFIGAVLIAVCACKSGASSTPPGVQGVLPDVPLPTKAFVQGQQEAPGTIAEVDAFLANGDATVGVLKRRVTANGLSELGVEENGAFVVIAPASGWAQLHAIAVKPFRAACGTRFVYRGRGASPAGVAFAMDTSAAPELVCFVNPHGSPAWTPITVATGKKGDKTVALWSFLVTSVNPDAPDDVDQLSNEKMTGIELAWLEDEHWDHTWMTPASRTELSGFFSAVVKLDAQGKPSVDTPLRRGDYFDSAALVTSMDVTCKEVACGAYWTGRKLITCPSTCASGKVCKDNACVTGTTCEPKPASVACINEQGTFCGTMPDGCGGTVQCAPCAAGTCGGSGIEGMCGSYAMTEARLRGAYNDTASMLCGAFDDGVGGKIDLSATQRARFEGRECPSASQTCVGNLCKEAP